MASSPKSSYAYHLKLAAEPILLVTIVTSLALNLSVLTTQQRQDSTLHSRRLRTLKELEQENQIILSKSTITSPSPSTSHLLLPSSTFFSKELLLANKLKHLGLNPSSIGIHPSIQRQLNQSDEIPFSSNVAWSEALFGKPGQAKTGMRKAVAGIKEAMTRGIRRTEESQESERQALQDGGGGGKIDHRENWTDEDWERGELIDRSDSLWCWGSVGRRG